MKRLWLLTPLLLVSACAPATSEPEHTGEPEDTEGQDSGDTAGSGGADSTDTSPAPEPLWPELIINELMASNTSTVQEPSGAWADWVELLNPTDATVSLDGWTLTDDLDEPGLHTLLSLDIAPGEHLILWADDDPSLGPDHLGFALDRSGEALGLFAPDGAPVDGLTFGQQADDISLARAPDGGEAWTLASPATPGSSNGD